ncbi:MAG: hypothetical protein J0I98_18805 [Mesorhizobium sp.]|nr:hypothetical protein [Mesorhizobium sp.]MBN9244838.1 hypothetical protein [Mesorhizobium sp.]
MATRKLSVGLSLAIFVIFALYFRAIILDPNIGSDLNAHIGFAKSAYDGEGVWPRHILYFALVALTSFWSSSLSVWETSGWLWLSLLVVAKFAATLWFGRLWLGGSDQAVAQAESGGRDGNLALVAIALCMTVVFCFPPPVAFLQGLWYSFSFPPNVWHNSTHIAVMPFAIVVFGLSVRQLEQPDNVGRAIAVTVMAIVSALAKPSFLMAWLPVYGLCTLILWWKDRSFRKFLIAILPVALSVAVLAVQYYLIYGKNINNASVKFGYMDAWLSRSGRFEIDFYISILMSSLFPIVFYLFFPARVKNLSHILAIGMVAISYFYAAAFSETGETQAGNFMWPIIGANFIAYMLCIFDLHAICRRQKGGLRAGVPAAVFALCSIWGVAYMVRYLLIGGYG